MYFSCQSECFFKEINLFSSCIGQPVSCLRLLKKFSPKFFQQKVRDCEDENLVSEQTTTFGNRILKTEQLVELPFEQQIYDMIDTEGSKGLLGVDVFPI